MSSYTSFTIQLLEVEQIIDKIVELYDSVPSEYARGKAILDNVRVEISQNNMKEAKKLAESAHKVYREESIIASKYNRVIGSINYSTPTLVDLKNTYARQLAIGDLEGAEATVEALANIRPLDRKEVLPLITSEVIADTGGTLVKLKNSGNSEIYINRIELYGGGSALVTSQRFPFVLDSNAVTTVRFGVASGPVTGSVNYEQNGNTNTIELK